MWERYCRGVQAVVYVVDSADHEALDTARRCAYASNAPRESAIVRHCDRRSEVAYDECCYKMLAEQHFKCHGMHPSWRMMEPW